jgi:S-layer homology domain
MKKKSRSALLLLQLIVILTLAARLQAQNTGACGGVIVTIPFTDVSPSSVFFCAIAEAYFSGLTNGTGPTTYSPTDPVPRDQMAAFVTRTQDSAIKRSSRRAALNQWYTLGIPGGLTTAVGANPQMSGMRWRRLMGCGAGWDGHSSPSQRWRPAWTVDRGDWRIRCSRCKRSCLDHWTGHKFGQAFLSLSK